MKLESPIMEGHIVKAKKLIGKMAFQPCVVYSNTIYLGNYKGTL